MTELTIGIPTAQREQAVKDALDCIQENVTADHETLIADSSPSATPERYSDYDADVILPDSLVGPTVASQRLLDECDTSYLFYLHDDVRPRAGAVSTLLEHTINTPDSVGVVGGRMIEADGPTDPGTEFHFDDDADPPTVYDARVQYDDVGDDIVFAVDAAKPPIAVDVDTLRSKGVGWDPAIKFKLDQEDFYMSCHENGVDVHVHNGAIFDHCPYKYDGPSMQEMQDRETDHEYFYEKWGYYLDGFTRETNNG